MEIYPQTLLFLREFNDLSYGFVVLLEITDSGQCLVGFTQMYLNDTFTIPGNIAGIPALSIPIGFNGGLPVGLHLMARPLDEEKLLQIAFAYEQATGWHKEHPESIP